MMDKQLEEEVIRRLNTALVHTAEMIGETLMEKWRAKMLARSFVGSELNLALAVHTAEEEARKLHHCYRTGYVDGWIAGIGKMFDCLQAGASGPVAHAACYDHWEQHLLGWVENYDVPMPPKME